MIDNEPVQPGKDWNKPKKRISKGKAWHSAPKEIMPDIDNEEPKEKTSWGWQKDSKGKWYTYR